MEIKRQDTLWSWLQFHANATPEAAAIRGPDGIIHYRELATQVRAVASGLQMLGLRKGDVVAVQLPNIEAYVASFLAITACGGIVQTLHMPYRQSELRHLLDHSGARMAIGLSSFKDMSPASEMLAMRDALPSLQNVIAVGAPIAGTTGFSDLARQEVTGQLPDLDPDDPFLLLYTSGTTASPKGVPHTYRGFFGNAASAADELAIQADETLLSVAPYTHLYGLFVMHLCLARGAAQSLLPAFDPQSFLSTLAQEKPSGIFAAPAHFAPFNTAGLLRAEHLAHTRFTCLSGSAVPLALAASIDELMNSGNVIQLWGMSELQAGAYGRPGDPKSTRIGSAGRASQATELRVVDAEGSVLAADFEGELQVRGPSVFAGYLNNSAETEAAFTADGWFRTGDLATLDDDGFLTLTGRTKEVINRGGVKFNPLDVEAVLLELEAVDSCAIVPYADPDLGERACLCVQLCENQKLSLQQVIALLQAKDIAKYKWPERLEIIKTMPLTPTRKIMRGTLKQQISPSQT